MLQVARRLGSVCRVVHKEVLQHRQKVTAQAASVAKPFYYQDILQSDKPLNTPWKKLSGALFVLTDFYRTLSNLCFHPPYFFHRNPSNHRYCIFVQFYFRWFCVCSRTWWTENFKNWSSSINFIGRASLYRCSSFIKASSSAGNYSVYQVMDVKIEFRCINHCKQLAKHLYQKYLGKRQLFVFIIKGTVSNENKFLAYLT